MTTTRDVETIDRHAPLEMTAGSFRAAGHRLVDRIADWLDGMSRQTAASRVSDPAAAQPGVLGMLTPLLDSNKDGSVTDDVMGMLGKFLR